MDDVVLVAGAVLFVAWWRQREDAVTGVDVEGFLMADPRWWRSDTAARMGIDNTPPPAIQTNLVLLERACNAVFGKDGYDVTSGYRSPVVNLALAQSNDAVSLTSLHLRGRAADLYVHGMTVEEAGALARSSGRFVEVIEYRDGHLHVAIGA